MAEWIKHWSWVHTQNEEQKCARERMALFPANAETLFVSPDIWVVSKPSLSMDLPSLKKATSLRLHIQPVVRLEGKLCVFPGIPSLFQKMLDGLKAFLPLPPLSERPFRHQIFTPWVSRYKYSC
jgi:molybdopterin-biosynthesis enzyme MoeA-like protein